jgi:hypothetical protein
MRWFALLVVFAACAPLQVSSEHAVVVAPPLAPTYLRYTVRSSRGEWTREFVVGRRTFAERRETSGRNYTLGLAGARAWMRVGDRRPVEIDGPLAADERTEAAWIGMRFGEPESGEHLELESCHGAECTLVYTPHDGHALWVDVDRRTHRAVRFQWIAEDHSIEVCEDLVWSDASGAPAVASASCSAIVDRVGPDTTTWTLEERREDPALPEWARVEPEDVVPVEGRADVARFAIADPSTRVLVPVDAGGAALQLVLDTGSFVTVLSQRALNGLGVVRSPDPPIHVKPPWLPEDTYDPAIVDRLVIGSLELHGVPVLIARKDAPFDSVEETGLLGMDLLSRFVVDVDAPASTLRIWPERLFPGDGAFVDLKYAGTSCGQVVVAGAVDEIGPMPLILDTGAWLNVVVGGPGMHAKHPHHRDDEVMLREDDGAWDYAAEVNGFHLGPFGLPRMPVTGHDRVPDLPFLDGDSALVGLGVLRHFRIAVDAHRSVVHVAPGPSYAVLTRLGLEIDDRNGAPAITRIVGGEHDWRKPLREGDVVESVGGRPVRDRAATLEALASAPGRVRLDVARNGNHLAVVIDPRPPGGSS